MTNVFQQYDIWFVNLNPKKGSAQAGLRPCIIVQSDVFNMYSPVVTVIPCTSQIKQPFPSEFIIEASESNWLVATSRALWNQIMTVDKSYFSRKVGVLEYKYRDICSQALKVVLGLE